MSNNINLSNVTLNKDLFNRYPNLTDKQKEAVSRHILNPDTCPAGMMEIEVRYLVLEPVLGMISPRTIRIAAQQQDYEQTCYAAFEPLLDLLREWEVRVFSSIEGLHCDADLHDVVDVRFVEIWDVLDDGQLDLTWESEPMIIHSYVEDLLKRFNKEMTLDMLRGLSEFSDELESVWQENEYEANSEAWQELVMDYYM